MSMLTRLAATGAAPTVYVDDVFSTFLYTGNGSSQTITNGIDLSGKGGMVWTKARSSASFWNAINDSARSSVNQIIYTNSTGGQGPVGGGMNSFSSSGYSTGSDGNYNANNTSYVSWTFREQAKFFDVLTYTGDGTTPQQVSHNLGVVPGVIFVKATSTTGDWIVYHRSQTAVSSATNLNTNGAEYSGNVFNNGGTGPTSTVFGVQNAGNTNGVSYVAYLFAHDTSTSGLIQCGSYTGNGSATGPTVTLNWEPQWLMIKRATGGTGNWNIFDNMRGMTVGGDDWYLEANTADAEASANWITPTSTGFQIVSTSTEVNNNTDTYIYVAIRRSNKPPTAGTQVFQPTVYTGTNVDNRLVDTTIAPDMVWVRQRDDTVLGGMVVGDRLRGQPYMLTGTTANEVTTADAFDQQLVSATEYGTAFSAMNGFYCGNDATAKLNTNTTSNNHIALAFKRAPGFFDVVCYTGTGSAQTLNHSLGVAPELAILKNRTSSPDSWYVGATIFANGWGGGPLLDSNGSVNTWAGGAFNSTAPTATTIQVGSGSGIQRVLYLFASLPGISKVGTYTGNGGTVNTNGTSQTISCGFSAGARFVLVKRTDSTGDWYVFDSARGIVAANDPYLLLNSTAAEVTTVDAVDADNSGFIVNQTSGTNLNVTSATYIYLAIA